MNITKEEVQTLLTVLQEEADIYSEVPESFQEAISLLQSKLAEKDDGRIPHLPTAECKQGVCPACQKEDVEPVAYLAWRDGQPCWDEDCVCQDAVYPVDSDDDRTSMPVFTHPAKQTPWVGLTDEEVVACYDQVYGFNMQWGAFYKVIEAKLKEKNHAI